MADIGRTFPRRGDLETQLQAMFGGDRFILFANDFTEEDTPLALFYVRITAQDGQDAPPLRKDCDVHVGTWNKKTRKGWIFTKSYELLRTES